MCYSLYACARVKAVYAYLQLGQDARAKQVLDLALRIENELLASKHDSGLRARPFGNRSVDARARRAKCQATARRASAR